MSASVRRVTLQHHHRSKLNLQQEIPDQERILPQDQTTSISNDLQHQACKHAQQETPRLVPDAQADLCNEESGENGEVGHVAREGRVVVEEGVGAWAGLDGAVDGGEVGCRHGEGGRVDEREVINELR